MSEAAIIWVDDVLVERNPYRKGVLAKLAAVSDVDDCAWMEVGLLAQRVGCSERKVQYVLRELTGEGLLRETGRTHRKGTRRVPVYELVVDHAAVAAELSRRADRRRAEAEIRTRAMGAPACTHAPETAADGRTPCTRMGAPACTPNEDIREEEEANASSERARAGEIEVRLVEMWPLEALDNTDMRAVEAALDQIEGEGVDLDALVEAGRGYLAEKARQKGDHPARSLDRWLSGRSWEQRVRRAGRAVAAKAGEAAPRALPVWTGPSEVRAAFVEAWGGMGEQRAVSYLDPAAWDGTARTLTARTRRGAEVLAAEHRLCRSLNITIIAPGQAGADRSA